MGGLISSTVLTLIVLPTYYTMFDDLGEWVKNVWHESEPAKGTPSPAAGD
jgi:hypothetical protein